jgi:hypothetical protein
VSTLEDLEEEEMDKEISDLVQLAKCEEVCETVACVPFSCSSLPHSVCAFV